MKTNQFSAAIFLFMLVACSQDNENHTKSDSESAQEPAQSTLLDAQLDALQKSKEVGDSLQEQADKRRQEMEERGI